METMLPKLVAEDIPLLHSLLNDVFPNVPYQPGKMTRLREEIKKVCREMHLVYGENGEPGNHYFCGVCFFFKIRTHESVINIPLPSLLPWLWIFYKRTVVLFLLTDSVFLFSPDINKRWRSHFQPCSQIKQAQTTTLCCQAFSAKLPWFARTLPLTQCPQSFASNTYIDLIPGKNCSTASVLTSRVGCAVIDIPVYLIMYALATDELLFNCSSVKCETHLFHLQEVHGSIRWSSCIRCRWSTTDWWWWVRAARASRQLGEFYSKLWNVSKESKAFHTPSTRKQLARYCDDVGVS